MWQHNCAGLRAPEPGHPNLKQGQNLQEKERYEMDRRESMVGVEEGGTAGGQEDELRCSRRRFRSVSTSDKRWEETSIPSLALKLCVLNTSQCPG
jgi:hypothetical protein